MKILIGCPVTNREWILTEWFYHVDKAVAALDAEIEFAFVCGTSVDRTRGLLDLELALRPNGHYVVDYEEHPYHGYQRFWDLTRYHHMTDVRNVLLQAVRAIKPDYFLSLDSDILLHKDAISNLLESIEGYPAVGGKLYMTPAPDCIPSFANIGPNNNLRRDDAEGVMEVDVIMAMKLMRPEAYHIDYRPDFQGEDIGWSKACRESGLKLRWDGRVISKHVMHRDDLGRVDERLGW